MTAPAYCILDGQVSPAVAPRRPDELCEDLGGLEFANDTSPDGSPLPDQQLAAEDWLQLVQLVERLCRGMPILSIDFDCASSGTVITPVNFVARNNRLTTSNTIIYRAGVGLYSIAWPAGSMPTATLRPRVGRYGYGSYDAHVVGFMSLGALQIRIFDSSGTLLDTESVRVEIFGS